MAVAERYRNDHLTIFGVSRRGGGGGVGLLLLLLEAIVIIAYEGLMLTLPVRDPREQSLHAYPLESTLPRHV